MKTKQQISQELINKLGYDGAMYCVDLLIDVTKNYDSVVNSLVDLIPSITEKSQGHVFWMEIKTLIINYEKSA